MEKLAVDYKAMEAFVKNDRKKFDAIVRRFIENDESLTIDELAKAYYAAPFAGYKFLDVKNTADELYRRSDYRVAYFMYQDVLAAHPFSLMALKKAANCNYFAGIDRNAFDLLMARLAKLQAVVQATGNGKTAETAHKVTHVSDEYQILYDIYHVQDVTAHQLVKKEGAVAYDEMTIQILGQNEESKVFFACYGETEEDMKSFFVRKKTY